MRSKQNSKGKKDKTLVVSNKDSQVHMKNWMSEQKMVKNYIEK